MRILNVNSLIDPELGGGAAERTVQMSRALIGRGHGVGILSLDIGDKLRRPAFPLSTEIVLLKSLNDRFHVPSISVRRLRELVSQYQVIHLMGHWSILNAMVAIAASLEGVPYVVCPAGALPVFGRSRFAKQIYNLLFGRRLIRCARACIAVTQDERKHFADYGVDPRTVSVIPNGIEFDDFAGQKNVNEEIVQATGGGPYILFMGRLNPIKGPDLLLEAFVTLHQQQPDLHLVFAGPDGGLLKELRNRVSTLSLEDRVHFVGFLSGLGKVSAYRGALALAIPSRSEAMSIVVLEAGACGLPVVLTDQCGFNQVQSIGGGIVARAEADSLANSLLQLSSKDRGELRAMGARLYDFSKSNYAWNAVVDRYLEIYAGMIEANKVRT